jgi:hypothetical protein
MQQVGDYLLLRNQNLRPEHLNQPMNYVFLDINSMLKGLSQNSNINQVKEQLESISRYIRTIEKNISPVVGSDRLFLVNFRSTISERIMPTIVHAIESRLLQDRLQSLSKLIKQVSTERNRVLHFALNARKVNPHSYEFAIDMPEDTSTYPTQAAKACLEGQSALPSTVPAEQPPSLLKDCPYFKLMTQDRELETHYAQAIFDLKELDHFQTIITQINGLLEQAGEVYTIHQFKEQMLQLFEQTHTFLEESSAPVKAIIAANTNAYHQAIQDQQDLPLWKKLFTSEEEQLTTFIKNQDTLAQFPSGLSDLSKTNSAAQTSTREIIHHLSQPKAIETSLEAISAQAQELDQLMGTMHHWIANRYQQQGLPAPLPPSRLQLPTHETPPPQLKVSAMPVAFFSSTNTTLSPQPICSNGSNNCPLVQSTGSNNALLALGLFITLPVVIYGLYLLFKKNPHPQEDNDDDTLSLSERERKFTRLIIKFEDQLTLLRGFEQSSGQDLSDEYNSYLTTYSTMKNQAARGIYDVTSLNEAYRGLKYFFKDYTEHSESDTKAMC